MGKKLAFEVRRVDGGMVFPPSAVLRADTSHPHLDPVHVFRRAAARATSVDGLVSDLLTRTYPIGGGDHSRNDRVFGFVISPYDDCVEVHSAQGGADGFVVASSSERPVALHLDHDDARSLARLLDVTRRNLDEAPLVTDRDRAFLEDVRAEIEAADVDMEAEDARVPAP